MPVTVGSDGVSPLSCTGPSLSGNLEISVTTVPWFRNVRVKHFEDNAKVKNAILASACIVPPPLYLPGLGWAVDGAFSDFQILKVMHESYSVLHHSQLLAVMLSADCQKSVALSIVVRAGLGSVCGWKLSDNAQ